MRNFLRNRRNDVFATISDDSGRLACNGNGGVALWDLPDSIACAYNPMLFTRTRYLFRVGAYEPAQTVQPNYIHIVGNKLMCDFAVSAPLYIGYYNSNDEECSAYIPVGESSVTVSSIKSIIGVNVGGNGPKKPFQKSGVYIYICQGTAYEDEDFVCSASGVVLYKTIDTFDTSYLDIYKSDGALGVKLCAESIKGVTIFDVSAVVRNWLADHLSDDESADVILDNALFTTFEVKGLGGVNTAYRFMAVNAVAQIGEDSSLTAYETEVLTKMPELTFYEGYPLDYSILSDVDVCRVKVGDNTFDTLADHNGDDITIKDSSPIYLIKNQGIRVGVKPVPSQPFYVRWINQLGGVDYYMFSTQQKRQATVKSNNSYAAYAPDTKSARTNKKVYNITTENNVTVGANNIPNDVFAVLSKLPFSPIIEWYNEELRKWIALGVSKFDGVDNTKSNTNDIEITFNLPNINTQF